MPTIKSLFASIRNALEFLEKLPGGQSAAAANPDAGQYYRIHMVRPHVILSWQCTCLLSAFPRRPATTVWRRPPVSTGIWPSFSKQVRFFLFVDDEEGVAFFHIHRVAGLKRVSENTFDGHFAAFVKKRFRRIEHHEVGEHVIAEAKTNTSARKMAFFIYRPPPI